MARTKKAQTEAANAAGEPATKTGESGRPMKKPRLGRRKAVIRKRARSAKKVVTAKRRPKTRRGKRYTDAERTKILATAKREGLTGAEVSKRFGVSTLTYYLWRKKSGAPRSRGPGRPRKNRGGAGHVVDGDLMTQLREAVRQRLREILPELIRSELGPEPSTRSSRRR